jgi:hypothetical protein
VHLTCVEPVAIGTGGFSGTVASQAFTPLLTAGALARGSRSGLAGTTLLIALLARAALKGHATPSGAVATGMY